jgi:hypothetical protein
MGLYRMIMAAQRNDSHQNNCNRLSPYINVVTRNLFENELFALQVMSQLKQQIIRILVEWKNTDTGQNWEMLSEETNPIKYLQNFGMSVTYCKCPVSVKILIETFTKTNVTVS